MIRFKRPYRHDAVETRNEPKWVWDRLLEHGITTLSEGMEQDYLCVMMSRYHSHYNTSPIKLLAT